ncbi:MAG TPA: rod shape-determining protein MreC [Sedimentisphaerales bacterium]|nr:rod shape-determining protein MreC [Sedimentisphaerales bacterium]
MSWTNFRLSKPMLFTWLLFTAFILYLSPRSLTNNLHFAFVRLSSPLLNFGRSISSLSATTVERRDQSEFVSRSEYNRLENARANLKAELVEMSRQLDSVTRIQNRFPALSRASFVNADVIAVTYNRFGHRMTINRGRADGVREGLYVMADNSIIGAIEQVASSTSTIRLLTDPAARIFVQTKDGVSGVMSGAGRDACRVQLSVKLPVGEPIFAGKRPGLLDVPVIVGKVTESRPGSVPMLYELTVQPACDYSKVENVSVLIMSQPSDR